MLNIDEINDDNALNFKELGEVEMSDYTIKEDFELPSKGLVYSKSINPKVSLRSMTTEEEMKRLGHSPYVYKMFSDIIDDCLVDKPGIPVYDMCLGDYQYLLYKLRIVTYGSDYRVSSICPYCGSNNESTVNLDKLKINSYSDSLKKLMEFELPVSKKLIKLRLQTPRIIDEVEKITKEENSKSSDSNESAVLYNVMSVIETVDGIAYDDMKKEMFVRKLPMRDVNKILQQAKKCVTFIGLDTTITRDCSKCNQSYKFSLPITGEFFGPTED